MKLYVIILLLCLFGYRAGAQGENNIWTFGSNYSLDFNYNPPLLKDTTYHNDVLYNNYSTMDPQANLYRFAQAVCDPSGKLLFMVKNWVYQGTPGSGGGPSPSIFDSNEQPIAGTQIPYAWDQVSDLKTVIVPHPGNPKQYYIFFALNSGLLYSLFDLSLNGGRGDIVATQKNILLSNYNTISGSKLLAVQGCNGIWLVAKHLINRQFLSFHIGTNGVTNTPVVSEAGFSPYYAYHGYGELVASPDGKTIAFGTGRTGTPLSPGGIELYSFERCSGKLREQYLLDTDHDIFNVCFSPDNNKLYAAYVEPYTNSNFLINQYIYQFDMSLSGWPAITASKTLILTNPIAYEWAPFCPMTTHRMSNMKVGPNGKIYLSNNNPDVCPGMGNGMALHVIHNPNNSGLACNPQINAIWNQVNGMADNSGGIYDLPNQLILPPMISTDTPHMATRQLSICFQNDTRLKIPTGVSCPQWDNGSTDTQRTISQSGTYWLRYHKDCQVYVDTYKVDFIPLPAVKPLQYGCQGYITLTAGEVDGIAFDMDVFNTAGGKIYGGLGRLQHEIHNLDEGLYTLKIRAGQCDTTLLVELKAYPAADISIEPPFATIKYGEEAHLNATGGSSYTWTPASTLNSRTAQAVTARPEEDTRYEVVGINEYGCRDTAYATVKVVFDRNVRLPNAFSPNGDGKNDVFSIPRGNWKTLRFEVYNRYGQVVYKHSDEKQGWDGSYNGTSCDVGVYFYVISVSFPDGTNTLLKGDFHLIR